MRKSELIILGLVVVSVLIGIYYYPQMPSKVASHWNSAGEVDGYMGKFWGTFLMPIVVLAMFVMFIFIPKIDPLKKNVEKFRKYFDGFIVFISVFMFYIFILTLIWNLGVRYNMSNAIIPAIAILFYYCGVLVSKAKRNWFIGIRTPWTLSSDKVWDKTHKIGAKLFKICALFVLLSVFFPKYMTVVILIPTLSMVVYLFVYSYLEFNKLRGK